MFKLVGVTRVVNALITKPWTLSETKTTHPYSVEFQELFSRHFDPNDFSSFANAAYHIHYQATLHDLDLLKYGTLTFDYRREGLPTNRTQNQRWLTQLYNVVAQASYCHAHEVPQRQGLPDIFVAGPTEILDRVWIYSDHWQREVENALKHLNRYRPSDVSVFQWNRSCGLCFVRELAHWIALGRRTAEVDASSNLEELSLQLVEYYANLSEYLHTLEVRFTTSSPTDKAIESIEKVVQQIFQRT